MFISLKQEKNIIILENVCKIKFILKFNVLRSIKQARYSTTEYSSKIFTFTSQPVTRLTLPTSIQSQFIFHFTEWVIFYKSNFRTQIK